MTDAHAPDSSHYYIPHHSPWPIRGSIALFAIMLGAIGYLNDWSGAWSFLPGAVLLAYMFFGWFATVIDESQHGIYNLQVDRSFRMGMMWFIFSEVMFFAAFFGALFYARMLSVPWLGGQGVKGFTNFIPWAQFEGYWATKGAGHNGRLARPALLAGPRVRLALFLALTFLLGFTFVGLQAHEYGEAYRELGLRLSTGIYGSTFFMLTGFHGLHVTVGAIMLLVIWLRVLRGHFSATRHFAFEAVSWYWHFVDVVWLGLFIFVYWL